MKSVSTLALGWALALGSAASFVAAPASAQQPAQVPELSREERAAFLALQTALEAKNYPAATAALSSAQSAARSSHARYLASALQLRLGLETGNQGLQTTAIDSMIGSGAAPASELPQLYRNQAALLQSAGKLDRAEAVLTRYAELAPNDPDALLALAQVKADRKKPQESVGLIGRAIALRTAAGQPAPEHWYKRGLNLALMHQMAPESLQFARDLAAAYPNAINWRDALLVYRDVARPDQEAALDAWRLMRSAKALAGERDYLQFAQALSDAGLAAESKAVLDEGVAARMVDPGKAAFKQLLLNSGKQASAARAGLAARETAALAAPNGTAAVAAADAFLASGNHAKAATLYRAALEKGGVDANLVNMRLGEALAMAGNRAEAESAFRAVSGPGPRTSLASFWLAWLSRGA